MSLITPFLAIFSLLVEHDLEFVLMDITLFLLFAPFLLYWNMNV